MTEITDKDTADFALKGIWVSLVLVFIGGSLTLVNEIARAIAEEPDNVVLRCLDCGHTDEISRYEFADLKRARNEEWQAKTEKVRPGSTTGDMYMYGLVENVMPPWGDQPWALECPQCQAEKYFKHYKCPECDLIFLPNQKAKYADTCPECGYSRTEQRMKEQKEQEKN